MGSADAVESLQVTYKCVAGRIGFTKTIIRAHCTGILAPVHLDNKVLKIFLCKGYKKGPGQKIGG